MTGFDIKTLSPDLAANVGGAEGGHLRQQKIKGPGFIRVWETRFQNNQFQLEFKRQNNIRVRDVGAEAIWFRPEHERATMVRDQEKVCIEGVGINEEG